MSNWGRFCLRHFYVKFHTIKKEIKGYYVVIKIEAENVALKEFDRLTRIDNNVLRTLITVDQD